MNTSLCAQSGVLGIDAQGYSVCLYVVSLGSANFSTVHPMKIFKFALQADAVKIIIAQSKTNDLKLELNNEDFNLTNAIYHKSASLGLELYDQIIISNLSIKSKKPLYYSYTEHKLIEFISQDITHKTVNDSRGELDQEKADAILDEREQRNIEIVLKMLEENSSIDFIVKVTGLTEKEIKKIKKDIKK